MQNPFNNETFQKNIPLISGVLFVIGAVIVLWGSYLYAQNNKETINTPLTALEEITSKPAVLSPDEILIDGTVLKKDEIPEYPYAVMIDNHPDARPQFGLGNARIVYETLVEGSFTRYMALFQNSEVEKIGPVRSAREYFLDYVEEWNADYVHSGGAPSALAQLEDRGIKNVEEISYLGTKYFWRDTRKVGPHNLYTSTDYMSDARAYLEYPNEEENIVRWTYDASNRPPVKTATNTADTLSINWSHDYEVQYEYSERFRVYERFINSKPDVDAQDAKQITAHNILVLRVPPEEVVDAVGRIELNVTGTGEMTLFRDGVAFKGTWIKETAKSATKLLDMNNNPLVLAPGTTWVEVVPETREVSYK